MFYGNVLFKCIQLSNGLFLAANFYVSQYYFIFKAKSVLLLISEKKKYLIISLPAVRCSKLTIETLEQRCERCSKLTIKHISHLCSSVSIVNFEHVNASWDVAVTEKTQ